MLIKENAKLSEELDYPYTRTTAPDSFKKFENAIFFQDIQNSF